MLAADVAHLNPSVLESMSKAQELINTVLKFGQQVSELNPIAKVTLGICVQAWETLKRQAKYDKLVVDLVVSMGDALYFVDSLKDQAKIMALKMTIIDLLNLIEDASKFVVEYKSDGAAVRAVQAFLSSSAQEQVDEFTRRFESLKQDFSRGIGIQSLLAVEALLNDADRDILIKLMTPDCGYDPSAGCLDGTRMKIQDDIQKWVHSEGNSRSLFWLWGLAGCGKSTVAHSVCEQLRRHGHLAAAFFCKRDKEQLCKPENIVSTLAANLSFACQPYGTRLAAALRANPQLASSALAIRFPDMITELIQAIEDNFQRTRLVIVVDALDECGTIETRVQLMTYLLEISEIAPWLKVIVTSRPNEELMRLAVKKRGGISQRDLFQEDQMSVTHDIELLIHHRLAQLMDDDEANQRGWLEDGTVRHLANRANGLFIWAQTACNMIINSLEPEQKIKKIISGESAQDPSKQLDSLYETVLHEALGGLVDSPKTIRSCIAAVVVACEPLTDTALAELLGKRISLVALRSVIRRLSSVIYRDHYGAVRVLHHSFTDYILDERCSKEHRIKGEDENLIFATSCLRTMTAGLKFNICDLEDSRLFNHQVSDLQTRISAKISPCLNYSCLYWASHLAGTDLLDTSSQRHQEITELLELLLFGPMSLYWIEVLSLLGKLHTGEAALHDLRNWIRDPSHTIAKQSDELQRFIGAFYLPISQSTPHLYISSITFGREQLDAIQVLMDYFPNTAQIAQGKHLGKASKRLLRVIPHPAIAESVSYSQDGNLIATGSHDGIVRLWNAFNGAATLEPLKGHVKSVTSVAFSPDNRRVVSSSQDATIKLWSTTTGELVLDIPMSHYSAVMSVAYSPEGGRIVSGSWDGKVRVWDAHTGTPLLHSLQGRSGSVKSVAFSPDGRYVVTGSMDSTVRMWDAVTGRAIFRPFQHNHDGHVTSVAFSPDGQRIASGSADCTVRLWNAVNGTAALEPLAGHSHWVMTVAFSHDSQLVASGSYDKTIRVWDAHTGALVLLPLMGHSFVMSVAFSPDRRFLVSGSYDHTVRVWDAGASTAIPDSLPGHSSRVNAISLSSDGQYIASGSDDSTVQVWDANSSAAVFGPLLGHLDKVTAVAFSHDGQLIASGSSDKTIRLWDVHDRKLDSNKDSRLLWENSKGVTCVAFSPDDQHLVSGCNAKALRVWDIPNSTIELSSIQGHTESVLSVTFSPSGEHIVSGASDMTIRLWNARTGEPTLNLRGHSGPVTSVTFSLDGKFILSGSSDETVRLWDALSGSPALAPMQGRTGSVTCVAFSRDSERIVSSSSDKTILVWDTRTGTTVHAPLRGHSDSVSSVAFSPNAEYIVSGSDDATVRLWDLSAAKKLALPSDFPSSTTTQILSYQLASSLNYEGWAHSAKGELLLWLPDVYRRWNVDHSIFSISKYHLDHPVSFDFTDFRYGVDWRSVCS